MMWRQLPMIKLLTEWRWVRTHIYPAGQVPWIALAQRAMAWYWRRLNGQLDQPGIIQIPYAPVIELLVPSLKHEYSLFMYHTPLFEAEFFLLPALVQPDMIALNIGAHIGAYTLALAQLLPHGHVYAFEPALATYRQLQINILWNQARQLVPQNITTFRLALGNANGETQLFHGASTMQASIMPTTPDQPYERVPIARLDTWLEHHHIHRVDFVVIDVEGAEDVVLSHAANLLQRDCKPLILCEFNRKFGRQVAIWELLCRCGYRFWRYHAQLNQIEPVADPNASAIYIHQTHQAGRGYGNVIAAPASWTPPHPILTIQQR